MLVLTNSIMLVCIAFDRYMAIVRVLKGSWEPSKLFCLACCTIIWGFSAAVSSPLISIYEFHRVYVIPEPEKQGDNLTYYTGYLCFSDKVKIEVLINFSFNKFLIYFSGGEWILLRNCVNFHLSTSLRHIRLALLENG